MTYTQLTQEQRYQIYALLKTEHSQTKIAIVIGVDKSTISREVRRNCGKRGYRSNQLRVAQLREAYESSLTMLANVIEVRDSYSRGHVERVRDYAIMMAEQMGWNGRQLDQLRYGAILHDIGKFHIRESILRKKERLNKDEWDAIREHPVIGG